MTGVETILEHVRMLVVQHVPTEVVQKTVPLAVICLVAGIGLSVLGAKLSRFGFVASFAVLGGIAGARLGGEIGLPAPVCGLLGALMLGVIGYQSFRLWVAVTAGVVLTSVVLGIFGYQRVVPHVEGFAQSESTSAVTSPGSFALPSPQEQQAYRDRTPRQWVADFWAFVATKDGKLERNGKALAIVALVTGLALGFLAVRTALILTTSVMGTALVTTSMATLLAHTIAEPYQVLEGHPGLIGMAVGGFFVTSLILQTLLTRKAPQPKPKPAPAPKS